VSIATPTLAQEIAQRLQSLAPESVALTDESGQHVGHAGAAGGGGHYRLTIVAEAFTGKALVARHRMVYAALGDLMHHRVHALAIEAFTPQQL
jgi:BolA family transcriptional regulator, general stress-responsive regulator